MDGKNGMLCVHVIGYKRGYKLWYKIYKLRHTIYKLYRIFTSFIKISYLWLEHQGNKRVAQGVGNGWMRDRVVIDNGSV